MDLDMCILEDKPTVSDDDILTGSLNVTWEVGEIE